MGDNGLPGACSHLHMIPFLLKIEHFYPWGIYSSIMSLKDIFVGAITAIIWALGRLL